jgi:hypothetical protein
MEEESEQKINPENVQNHPDEQRKEEPPAKPPSDRRTDASKGLGWGVWLLIALIVFLFVSSIANLVVSHRAYESSKKQVTAIEQLTQSIKDIQRSIVNLSRMLEQAPSEEEEFEEDSGTAGDGSI